MSKINIGQQIFEEDINEDINIIKVIQKTLKEREEEEKDYNNQRNYIIKKFIELTDNFVNEKETLAILHYLCYSNKAGIGYYISENDKNLLLAMKIINKFSREHQIKNKDTILVFKDYIDSIKSLNDIGINRFITINVNSVKLFKNHIPRYC